MKSEKNNINNNQISDNNKATDFSETKYKQIGLEDSKEKNDEEVCDLDDSNKEKKKVEEQIQLKIEENTTSEEKEKLEEAQQAVKKQSTKKKKWLNLIFLLINIGVVAGILTYQILNENSISSFADLTSKINWGVIVLIIVVFGIIMFLESARFSILTYKATGKRRMSLCYKVSAIGRYYDNVTPFAAGGQPFQIYYLNKNGIPPAESLSIPLGRYVIWQLSFVTFTLVIMIFSISLPNFSNAGTALVTASSWIGFAINSALVLLVGLISISKKVGNGLIGGLIKLLHKIKIVKDYDKQYNKIMKLVNDYQSQREIC
jgi:cation transport ATPase